MSLLSTHSHTLFTNENCQNSSSFYYSHLPTVTFNGLELWPCHALWNIGLFLSHPNLGILQPAQNAIILPPSFKYLFSSKKRSRFGQHTWLLQLNIYFHGNGIFHRLWLIRCFFLHQRYRPTWVLAILKPSCHFNHLGNRFEDGTLS